MNQLEEKINDLYSLQREIRMAILPEIKKLVNSHGKDTINGKTIEIDPSIGSITGDVVSALVEIDRHSGSMMYEEIESVSVNNDSIFVSTFSNTVSDIRMDFDDLVDLYGMLQSAEDNLDLEYVNGTLQAKEDEEA